MSEKSLSSLNRLQVSENTTICCRRWRRRRSERKREVYNLQWTWHYYNIMKKEELISSTVLYSLSEICDQPYSNAVLCNYSTWTLIWLLYMLICILFYWNNDNKQISESIDIKDSIMRREILYQSHHIVSMTVQHYSTTVQHYNTTS